MSVVDEYPSRRARRLYRMALSLYPKWFRELYAHQMENDFIDLFRGGAGASSLHVRLRCWRIALSDLVVSLPREWWSTINTGRPRRPIGPAPRGELMSAAMHDMRYAVRMLRHHLGFSAMVITTLALGIGANVAMFTVVDAVLLSPLPYADAERLVMVWNRHVNTGADRVQISGRDYLDYRSQTTAFEDFAFMHNATDNTLSNGPPEQVDMGYVSHDFFGFLGREPMHGRSFIADESEAGMSAVGGTPPAIISYSLWSRRYGSDRSILGRSIQVSGRPMEVIGVLQPDFELVFPYSEGGGAAGGANPVIDIWSVLPERAFANFPRTTAMFRVLARLKADVTLRQAQAEMDALASRLRDEHSVHEERGTRIDLVPMHAEVVGSVKAIILSLFGAVGFVLLIACANVANLVLVRAANRQREVAVRVALGARRARLVRQLMTENALLAAVGTVLGLLLAAALIRRIVGLAPADVPMLDDVALNGPAMLFAVGIAVVTILLFGLWPAIRGTRVAPLAHLNDTPRSGGGRGHRIRAALVTAEVALSLVLLIGGGLLVRTFWELQRARLGFDSTAALTAKIALPHGTYDDDGFRVNYWRSLRQEAADLAGVVAVGLVWPLPFTERGAAVPYGSAPGDSDRYVAAVANASPGYFEAMEATLVDGRQFEEADLIEGTAVAVVDDILAERMFPGETAVGRTLWIAQFGSDEPDPREIVGVVRHIRHTRVAGPEREVIYLPSASAYRMALVVRTVENPLAAASALRRITGSLDSEVPLFDERLLEDYLRSEIAPTRFTMTLASSFALLALAMAAVGLYGVISYAVTQRWSELGVRVALGADGGDIARLVLRHGAGMAGAGIAVGLLGAVGLTRAIRSLLVGVAPTDGATFLGVSLLLALVAMVASYIPARRAARLDPVVALRHE